MESPLGTPQCPKPPFPSRCPKPTVPTASRGTASTASAATGSDGRPLVLLLTRQSAVHAPARPTLRCDAPHTCRRASGGDTARLLSLQQRACAATCVRARTNGRCGKSRAHLGLHLGWVGGSMAAEHAHQIRHLDLGRRRRHQPQAAPQSLALALSSVRANRNGE